MASETDGLERAAELLDCLAPQVRSVIRQRGKQYLRDGAVTRLAIDDFGVRAKVIGTSTYVVTLLYDGDEDNAEVGLIVRARCTCDYFARGDICKHIWATLLAAAEHEGGRRLPRVVSGMPVVLDPDPDLPVRGPDAPTMVGDPVVIDFEGLADAEDEDDYSAPAMPRAKRRSRPAAQFKSRGGARRSDRRHASSGLDWKSAVHAASVSAKPVPDDPFELPLEHWPADRQIVYVLDLQEAIEGQPLTVEITTRRPKRNGGWTKPQPQRIARRQIPHLPDADDRRLLALLSGAQDQISSRLRFGELDPFLLLEPAVEVELVQRLCATGRCMARLNRGESVELSWRDEPAWSLHMTAEERSGGCLLRGELRQPAEAGEAAGEVRRMPVNKPRLLTPGGLLIDDNGGVGRFDAGEAYGWVTVLRQSGEVFVPADQVDLMLEQVLTWRGMPPVELPERLAVEREVVQPKPGLLIHQAEETGGGRGKDLAVTLLFDYGEQTIPQRDPNKALYDRLRRRVIERDFAAEQAARQRLRGLGVREATAHARYSGGAGEGDLVVAPRLVPGVVAALVEEGWVVEAEGKLHRGAAGISMDIRGSGIDWFEVHGEADFGGQTVELPQILQALQRGDKYVRLDDGSLGMLPQKWLERYGPLVELGRQNGDGRVQLSATQIGLIDALLTQMPEVDFDEQVAEARKRLEQFDCVRPRKEPRGFVGELRPYQREGLGWLHFLREIGFGGCLADDMGLGKTIQVLALLEARRVQRRRSKKSTPPSLVVAPRSLVHNWEAEAKRFTPRLRVLDHTGPQRLTVDEEAGRNGDGDPLAHFDAYDLVLTTYGTLRQDIALLKDFAFDYVVLDEAQAIKNAATASAKAARLLRGQHRLALSGTPIENHVGELVSLFSFLNPGMFGDPQGWLNRSGAAARDDAANAAQCELLARAVRPVMLRRTKEQVAPDLPEKSEQTLYCDLPAKQRQLYDELRRYFNAQVLGKIESRGLGRSKIDVLQALLRLRQAACHPGLIDKAREKEKTAKLDVLLPHLEEIVEEGHKALVFSQFTSFLSIVRKQLEARKLDYAYIDGRVRKRHEQVERFQNDPQCKLFLISLKAGGTGLNLTAADYVFLLDPWWNPAVEAQAIDRAHRIGQDKRVHAYRLIAADTVEEKVLELQQSKRELADAIIRADANLIRELSMDDLRYLLS